MRFDDLVDDLRANARIESLCTAIARHGEHKDSSHDSALMKYLLSNPDHFSVIDSEKGYSKTMVSLVHDTNRLVSGVKELLALRCNVVDGIGHYGGTEDAYEKLTLALAKFCMLAQSLGRSRL